MTQKEIKKAQKDLDKYYDYFNTFLSEHGLDMLSSLVELELQLEAECGR